MKKTDLTRGPNGENLGNRLGIGTLVPFVKKDVEDDLQKASLAAARKAIGWMKEKNR